RDFHVTGVQTCALPICARLGGLLARPALRAVAARMDPSEYGAQPLLGVDGYAFIGHGSADAKAVTSALRTASKAVSAGALQRTRSEERRVGKESRSTST